MAISKEMEDWFLRGGKRPETNGMQETLPEPPDEIPVDDDEDDDGGDEHDYIVTMTRTRVVSQRAKVRVRAGSESDAMDEAEDLPPDEQAQWSWEDDEDTEEFEGCEAYDAEEAD